MKKQGKEWSAKCPMLGAVAVMMGVMAAFAEPSVEITKGKLADAHDGTVEYAYTVRGDFKGRKYDLLVKISSDDGTKSVVLTNENVSAGSVTRTVNVKTLLGKAYPGVTIFASLEDKGKAGVQLWAGGPYFAECNLGATRPEDYGWYFWWGDTVGYELNEAKDGWVSVVDGTPIVFGESDATATSTYNKNTTTLKSEGWIDGSGNLVAAHDAATAKLGAPWRMMTVAELKNLVNVSVCKRVWVANYKSTGVTGYLVTGATEGYTDKSIFLPAAGSGRAAAPVLNAASTHGYYWCSTPNGLDSKTAPYLYFFEADGTFYENAINRFRGFSVRPVQ